MSEPEETSAEYVITLVPLDIFRWQRKRPSKESCVIPAGTVLQIDDINRWETRTFTVYVVKHGRHRHAVVVRDYLPSEARFLSPLEAFARSLDHSPE